MPEAGRPTPPDSGGVTTANDHDARSTQSPSQDSKSVTSYGALKPRQMTMVGSSPVDLPVEEEVVLTPPEPLVERSIRA
ncbi:hypothetical protein BO70DRAFT_358257 [Aspergillus heteromorphus CBS 117.55]|uniref:Uncharacterized protein n=1 Tax=Aspergillus heteromorphus CBS 117.55 TaxID=1448321 RepID=A0A317WWP6_9EURO|nr:uncharacterized protein BO70DRAFT_358257 [Aspergillus heteromorphus CBS 117.55]PWY90799.1 hypothetical protein BO70DRAFT_358257 [Aspergillus heteromorphus CBS 117.55]